MRFCSVMAGKYRVNGYIFIAHDIDCGYHDLFIQYPNGKAEQVDTFTNRGIAIKEAKRLAMTDKLGFNPALDVF